MAIFLNKYQHYLIYALILWILLGIYYGDVMYVAQQNSFFSTEGILMNFLTSHYPYGYLWYIGRGFLQLFYYPLLGSALYTFILISISILLSYVFNLKGRWKVLQFIPGLLWIAFLFFQGFNIYYQHETGKIIGIPFCILIILTLQSLFISTFNKRTIGSALIIADTEKKRNLFNNILLVLVSSLLIIGNEIYRPYVRPTVKMQKALQNEDWETMIRTAKDCDVIVRPIAAYYAIALMQTGQITQSLFDIDFNYSEIYLHDRNGDKDYGAAYYQADGNFHAGLLNSAYKNAMEQLTMDGPNALNLKMLAETSLLNGETELCNKYLTILSKLPFEHKFVKKIKELNQKKEQIENDERLSKIKRLIPVEESFETWYREPLFLGYNIALLQGRSMEALDASLAACLYTKLMPDFLIRTQPLIDSTLKRNIEDALTMEASKNNKISEAFHIGTLSLQKYNLFMNSAAPYRKNRKEGAKKLKEQFLGYYPYYYFFGNIKSENKEKATKTENKPQIN